MKPNSKLSWQYHNRRAEICRVYKGEVGISRSFDDNQKPQKKLINGDNISIDETDLSKREWNELMIAFNLKDKLI